MAKGGVGVRKKENDVTISERKREPVIRVLTSILHNIYTDFGLYSKTRLKSEKLSIINYDFNLDI